VIGLVLAVGVDGSAERFRMAALALPLQACFSSLLFFGLSSSLPTSRSGKPLCMWLDVDRCRTITHRDCGAAEIFAAIAIGGTIGFVIAPHRYYADGYVAPGGSSTSFLWPLLLPIAAAAYSNPGAFRHFASHPEHGRNWI
jgi:hypothetical protein